MEEGIAALSKQEIQKLPVLSLSYVGDSVFDIYIRMIAAGRHHLNAKDSHSFTVKLVNAVSQSAMAEYLIEHDLYTGEEQDIFRRGRNAKPAHLPKNASVADYHRATGFEAVLGYLYMTGDRDRAFTICELAYRSTLPGEGEEDS